LHIHRIITVLEFLVYQHEACIFYFCIFVLAKKGFWGGYI
jgi:hypothetical protein